MCPPRADSRHPRTATEDLAATRPRIAAALALTLLMAGMLYGVRSFDPATLVSVTLAFALIACVACWIPARRAAALEPMEAMRVE